MKPTTVHIFPNNSTLGQAAAQRVADVANETVMTHGRFTVAFSGGSLPSILCPALVSEPLCSQIDWSAWHVAWADERFAPLINAESNYRLLREALFEHVPIPVNQIFALNETVGDVESAANAYQAQLAGLFHATSAQLPRFDLILLGMGPDGHVASLFPHHPLLSEQARWVAAINDSPKPPLQRITFTLPLINAARNVFFIVTGGSKAEKVKAALTQPPSLDTPAGLIGDEQTNVEWFLDESAASVAP